MNILLRFFLTSLCLLASNALWAQTAEPDSLQKPPSGLVKLVKQVADYYLNDLAPPGKPRFLFYPTIAYAPETSVELGAAGLLLYNARKDTMNRLSEVSAFTFITLNRQYGVWIDHYLYTHQDAWFFLGRLRYQRFPLLYYGIGPSAGLENEQLVDATNTVIRERVLRRILPNLFIGAEVDYQQLSRVAFAKNDSVLFPLPTGARGSGNLGLGLGLVYDSRHNALNVRKGLFAEAALLRYHPNWGSTFNFRQLTLDVRSFSPVNKRQVFAAQVFGQFLTGDVPFNQLALAGGDALLRGYYYGRYRDKNYLAAQAEYRWLPFAFSRRFGATVFAGAGRVAPEVGAFSFNKLMYSGGAGLRFLVFPRKDIFVRFDVGATTEGVNFYFYTGEAF